MLVSVVVLGAAALAAVFLAHTRPSPAQAGTARRRAARALALAVGVQSVHFAEEAATGFHHRFPALFGLPDLPFPFFMAFNLAWIAIWIASIPGLVSGRSAAFFAAWFLAIAGMMNGVAHPLMAVVAQDYFPGLGSAVFMGTAGALLWTRLRHATAETM